MAKKRKTTPQSLVKESRERLKGTPFTKAEELKKASQELRKKTWEQLEKARIFNEIIEKPEYECVKKEFKEGLRCKYSDDDASNLIRVYSKGVGVEVDINKNLVKDIPHSGAFVETLIRSLGDTFLKSYYQAKGIIPSVDINLEDLIANIKKSLEKQS